jgi:hypothetical protein
MLRVDPHCSGDACRGGEPELLNTGVEVMSPMDPSFIVLAGANVPLSWKAELSGFSSCLTLGGILWPLDVLAVWRESGSAEVSGWPLLVASVNATLSSAPPVSEIGGPL